MYIYTCVCVCGLVCVSVCDPIVTMLVLSLLA